MNSDDESFGYVGVKHDEENDWRSFWMSTDFNLIENWTKEDRPKSTDDNNHDVNMTLENDKSSDEENIDLDVLLNRAVKSGIGQYHLIETAFVTAAVFARIAAQNEIIKPIEDYNKPIRSGDRYEIYALNKERFIKLLKARERLEQIEGGLDSLPSAVMMSVVASFDSSLSDIVRTLLRRQPESYLSGERSIPLRELLSMSSFEDAINHAIDEETYQFSRGSHEEQIKFIEKKFGISISEKWKRWPDFIEIFERRNLVAHGEKLFTKRYVANCDRVNHKGAEKLLGNPVELRESYLVQSIDVLLECEILLIFSLWRKRSKDDDEQAFSNLVHVVFELIKEKRYRVSICLIEYALSIRNTAATEMSRRMLAINLSSAYFHNDNASKGNDVLSNFDWTVSADNFQICVFALKKDIDGVCSLMKSVSESGKITRADFREWPVFDFVRNEEQFASEFMTIFGEPVFEGSSKPSEHRSTTNIEPEKEILVESSDVGKD